jgi:GNAT superfamily N-acetyltransferase
VTLVRFSTEHVLPAAHLATAGVRRLRASVPALPDGWTDPAAVARVIAGLEERGAGLAVLDDGVLVAFHAAVTLDGRGGRFTYTPDLGHAAPPDPEGRARTHLYAGLADGWIREACPEHVITVLADDDLALAVLARLGFGHLVVDLVADLRPIAAGPLPDGVSLRRAGPGDAAAIMEMDAGLRRHLEASPVFLRPGQQHAIEVHRRHLEDPAVATFLAERDGAPVAFLRIGPCATDVASIVRDPGTASVSAAFTRPELRGLDVASHLLAEAVDWARAGSYARWAVDHESANREAARFWARHATPVAISLSRRLAPPTGP